MGTDPRREPGRAARRAHRCTPRAVDSDDGPAEAIAVAGDEILVSESDGATTWVQRYDGATGAPGTRINVANGVERIIQRGDILWVLTAAPDLLHRYDATIGTRLSSTEVGDGAESMVVSDGVFWVTGSKDGSLTRVDERTQETERFELGGSPQNVRVGLGAVWVTNATKGALQGFDPDTGDVREIPAGERPFSLVLAEDGIWVGDTAENKIRFGQADQRGPYERLLEGRGSLAGRE